MSQEQRDFDLVHKQDSYYMLENMQVMMDLDMLKSILKVSVDIILSPCPS